MLIQPETIQLGQTEHYTFGAYIKRGNNTVLDIAVEAIDTPESIRKAMNTVRRMMTSYAPNVTPIVVAADQAQTAHVSAKVATSMAGQSAAVPEPAATSTPPKEPDGTKGLVMIYCKECGSASSAFLKERQSEIVCRTCGHHTDLTVPLAKFHFTCPHCEKESWGLTNAEEPDIAVLCKCGQFVNLRWVPKAKEYRN